MVLGYMSQISSKAAVRAAVLSARRSMSPAVREAADRALVAAAADLVRGAGAVAGYAPTPGKPGGTGLVDGLAAAVGTLLLPVLRPDLDLDWARYAAAGLSSPSRPALLREPTGPRLGTDAIGQCVAVIVPALAVDHHGVRLGRGGGSFDRALARVPPATPVVALLYDGELCEALPADPHDRPVTAVITPSGVRSLPLAG